MDGEGKGQPQRTRLRGLVAGFTLLPLVAYASSNALSSHLFSLLISPVAGLLLLLVINAALRRVGREPFRESDLILAFSILWVGSACAAEWAAISHPPIHSLAVTAETDSVVRERLLPNLPSWLVLHDPAMAKAMAQGGGPESAFRHMGEVLPKYLVWGGGMALALGAMLCLMSLMRDAWGRTERLAFPMVQLPVAMAEQGGKGPMWRSRAMWIAFAIMFAIDLLNGFSYLFPNVPSIPVKELTNLQTLFPEPPLNQVGYLPLSIYPLFAAIGLLIPADLLFSLVLFFLLRKAAHVVLAANGVPQHTFSGTGISPGPPYFDEQTWGAVLAIFLGALWYGRAQIKEVVRSIRSGSAASDGGLRHRSAFVGFLVCFLGLVTLGVAAGFPVAWMALYVALILIFALVLARLRAQLGPPTHEFAYFAANSFMIRLFGNLNLTDRQAAFLSTAAFPFNRLSRAHPAPYQLEAFKMGADSRVPQRVMFWSIGVAGTLAFVLALVFLAFQGFRTGNANAWPEHAGTFRALTENRHGPDAVGLGMTAFGFLFVLALDAIRFRVPGFPIHPGGYVLGMNFGVDYYWFGLLLALIVKLAVLRYGGSKGFGKLRNVAFGIILGEVVAESVWMIMALATGQSTYTISMSPRGFGVQ